MSAESLKLYCSQQELRRGEDSCPSMAHSCTHTNICTLRERGAERERRARESEKDSEGERHREKGKESENEREQWNVLGQHALVYVVLDLHWANRYQMASGPQSRAEPIRAEPTQDQERPGATVLPAWTGGLLVSTAGFFRAHVPTWLDWLCLVTWQRLAPIGARQQGVSPKTQPHSEKICNKKKKREAKKYCVDTFYCATVVIV